MLKTTAVMLAAWLVAAAAFPQEKPQESFFSETIEVRVINVDVVVTGRDGKPVPGLSKDDFDIYENGQKRDITNFTEFRGTPATPSTGGLKPAPTEGTAAAPDTRTRRVVLFLDSSSLQPFNRKRVLEPMQKFVATALRPGDQVMLVNWKPGLDVAVPFTTNVADVQKAIKDIASTITLGAAYVSDMKHAEADLVRLGPEATETITMPGGGTTVKKPQLELGIGAARSIALRAQQQTHARVEALKSVIASMRGLDGRKAIVVLTETLSAKPGLPPFLILDRVKDTFEDGDRLNYELEARQFDDPHMVHDVGDLANSCGVTLYPISASGLGIDFDNVSAEHNSAEYSSGNQPLPRSDESLQTLREMAGITGGQALTGSNNFQLAFDTIANDLSTYYSLGYRAEGQRNDTVRTIDVKLRKPQRGLAVRARQSFVEKSLNSEMSDAVAANLFYPVAHNDLNVSMSAGTREPGGEEHVIVPLTIKVPTAGLTLIPQGTDLIGQFSSFTAFVRKDGKVSDVKRQQHQLRFPADSLKRRKEITVKFPVTIDPATEGVSVGVMDDASHATGFASLKLTEKLAGGQS